MRYLIDETFFFELNLFFKQGSLMKRIYTIYSELKENLISRWDKVYFLYTFIEKHDFSLLIYLSHRMKNSFI